MGGNLRIGEQTPSPLDLQKHCRTVIVSQIEELCAFFEANSRFLIQPSGSTAHLFDNSIDSEELLKHKPYFGDVDLQIPESRRDWVVDNLNNIQRIFSWNLLGHKLGNGQVITLWFNEVLGQNVQVDFEFTEYLPGRDETKPTEWSYFSRFSDWEDTKLGIKGVFHKFLLRALTSTSVREMKVMCKGGVVENVISNTLAFSVSKGLRQKYVSVAPGVVCEMSTKNSIYVTNVEEIFSKFFHCCPGPDELRLFHSFSGTILLIQNFLSKEEQKKIVEGYERILFGQSSQVLYRDDLERDRREKEHSLQFMKKGLGFA